MTTATHSGARATGSTRRAAAPPETGTIYVLAPVHNRRAITERFVRCLAAQTDQGFQLVLVDDGSKDGTGEMVTTVFPSATIIRGTGHWWWAGSLQQARRWLLRKNAQPGDLVLIANDDTSFGPDFLASARRLMGEREKTLLLAQAVSAQTGASTGIGVKINWKRLAFRPSDDPEQIDCFSTRGLFLRLEDFLALGGFHTVLLPHYLSDYEFTLRAARRGFHLRTDPSVRLVADEVATGIRKLDLSSAGGYLRSVISIKATKNPIYWTTFVLLASPRRWLVRNLLQVWYRFGMGLLKALRNPTPTP